ncbi:hypothetical protein HHK36_008873 [Tetracentron sinense]|uniref:Transcriptional elongation regulator MINIYO n=1 Tax=Tetracentron sinense TaxID=13715 RepID=A0A834ZH40_TETSI|nr:hypothetical protein HHK36_008873 [Tetracentron sinense]
MDHEDDVSADDDNYYAASGTISAFANPIQRKQKKVLDFSRWRDLISKDGSDVFQENKLDSLESDKRKRDREWTEIADKRNTFHPSLPQVDAFSHITKSGEVITSDSGVGILGSVVHIELDKLDPLPVQKYIKEEVSESDYAIPNIFEYEPGFTSLKSQTDTENCALEIRQVQTEVKEKMKPGLSEVLNKHGQHKFEKQRNSTSNLVSRSNFEDVQVSTSLESQIDAENRAWLQKMSHDEIAQAQAEIMDKMKPELVDALKKRGRDKAGKKKGSTSGIATSRQLVTPEDGNHLNQNIRDGTLAEGVKTSRTATTAPTKVTQRGLDNGGLRTLGTPNSRLWSVWSERVETARALRFSLDGAVVENDSIQVSKTGKISDCSQCSADNVTERDFLRTEGDPGAAGYTIKEAVALSRSMVPGQRSLALQILVSVLEKALYNIHQSQVWCNMRNANNIDMFFDWKAIWAFALGPEPELVLSLRMALDDNHISVVLACAKVIQCILSCDLNENFFDISEKMATIEKDLCTAPVFRGRPEIDVGFLHGGFWKYNTKPSNVLPFGEEIMDDESEGKHTIQDDIVVAGQDFAAGLVRMGILPRIRYLLENDPTVALEECLISILIGLARHSPTCANAIIKCQRLVQTVVDRFTNKDRMEIRPSKIKSVTLLKVLARSDKKNCLDFINNGVFRETLWHFYRYPFSLDHWLKSGREYCKLASALMVEQLRFWKVCIQYGYCVSYFADFFPALSMWLSPPTFEKLIENNVLSEFASITREAYLVLEALARRLPNLHSQEQLQKQVPEFSGEDMETWCWSHVSPMIELATKWISFNNNLYLSELFDWQKGTKCKFVVQDSSVSSLLWVISAVMHMLSSVVERVAPKDTNSLHESSSLVPWLPEFVPKIGIEIVKNRFLNFSGTNDTEYGIDSAGGGSLIESLCHLRHHSEYEISLSSICCLHGFIRLIVSIDKSIQIAKREICNPSQGYNFSKDGKILEDGIVLWSNDELRNALITFMKLVDSQWQDVQSIEICGRGGPAPGVGLGWGASGGGFWSTTVLRAQADIGLLIHLLEIFQIVLEKDLLAVEEMTFTLQRINSALGVCLIVGPRDTILMEKALNILLQGPVLKHLDLCIRHFLCLNKGMKSFGWEYKEEDYLCFSSILASHFRKRWLSTKKKFKAVDNNSSSGHKPFNRGNAALDTIHEDLDTSNMRGQDANCTSLAVEWAHQRLPLPLHWFLSPISTISYGNAADLPNASNIQNNMCSSIEEALQVAKSGLFLLLGLEAISSFLYTNVQSSPVQCVPLVWKLHSLSAVLLVGMGVLEEEKSRDVYWTLQELYGKFLEELRCSGNIKLNLDKNENFSPETGNICGVECLRFHSDVHENYSTFIENLVEQFSAVSYGDVIYGRQVAMYLHRYVEAPVRLAAWNALSNAHILELLPPLEKCFVEAEGYLEPIEDNEGILEAYVKSWISGVLDRAATRGSIAFTLVLHHLSSFIFHSYVSDKLLLRNKLMRSVLRDYSRKPQREGMVLDFIRYRKPAISQQPQWKEGSLLQTSELERRLEVLTEACEGNSSLLTEVEKLKLSCRKG